jgi:hypothetical protein
VRRFCIVLYICTFFSGCIETWSERVYLLQQRAFALESMGDYEGAWRLRKRALRYQRKLARAETGVPPQQFPR